MIERDDMQAGERRWTEQEREFVLANYRDRKGPSLIASMFTERFGPVNVNMIQGQINRLKRLGMLAPMSERAVPVPVHRAQPLTVAKVRKVAKKNPTEAPNTGTVEERFREGRIVASDLATHDGRSRIAAAMMADFRNGLREFLVASRCEAKTLPDVLARVDEDASVLGNRKATFGDLLDIFCFANARRHGFSRDQIIKVIGHYASTHEDYVTEYDSLAFEWSLYRIEQNPRRMLRLLAERNTDADRKRGFVSTPPRLAKEMIERLSLTAGQRILDPACGRGTFLLLAQQKIGPASHGHLFGIDIDPAKAFVTAALLEPLNIRVPTIFIGNALELISNGEIPMPHFDAVIGNPPYQSDLHLKFLSLAHKVARHVVLVHPAGWVTAQKPGSGSMKAKGDAIKEQIGNNFVSLDIIHGNRVFGIGLTQPCVITHIDTTKSEPGVTVQNRFRNMTMRYESAMDINPFDIKPDVFARIREKIWNACAVSNIHARVRVGSGNFYVNMPNVSGHVGGDNFIEEDFYQLLYASDQGPTTAPANANVPSGAKQWIAFNTETEAKNFWKYLRSSNIAKFSLMIVKINNQLERGELRYVPFFDFTEEQTDERIANTLGLSEEDMAVINSVASSNGRTVRYTTE